MMNEVRTAQSRCRAGVARGDITPPVGIYHRMWGAATHDRSTGVHRPLSATVMWLTALGDHPAAAAQRILIALDHCLFWKGEMDWILDCVAAGADVPRESLVVFFSHTHGAGLMGRERAGMPGGEAIGPYLEQLAERLTQWVIEAGSRRSDATVVYGQGRCDLAANRDYFDEQRQRYVCGYNPTGPTDDTLVIARVISDTDATLATVVNYACHPTTLAWENTLISPDYVGAMRELVETATGAPCFFIQGASGDLGPREGYVGDTAVADRNGRRLGYAALAVLEGLTPPGQRFVYAGPVESGTTLGTWRFEPLPDGERSSVWRAALTTVSLAYREPVSDPQRWQEEVSRWEQAAAAAAECGRNQEARDARAMAERARRRLTRCASLPPGDTFPFPLNLWRIGDAVWVALDGEHYHYLQQILRQKFARTPLIIGTLANGSNAWYLPTAEAYGKGLYQEEVSVVARGSLEQLTEAVAREIQELVTTP